MIDLHVHEVFWCVQHGHPVLALRAAAADRFFAVALAAEDAASLAIHSNGRPGDHARFYPLLEAAITGLGARLTEVRLHVGADRILRASLFLSGPRGPLALPASFVDGILLAHRGRRPLRIVDADLARVPETTLPAVAPEPEADESSLAPFRHFIESLDLDGLGGDRPSPSAGRHA